MWGHMFHKKKQVGSHNLLIMLCYLLNNLGKSFFLAVNNTSVNWLAVKEKERVGKWLHVKSNGVREKVASIYLRARELVIFVLSWWSMHACGLSCFLFVWWFFVLAIIIVTSRTWNIYMLAHLIIMPIGEDAHPLTWSSPTYLSRWISIWGLKLTEMARSPAPLANWDL